MPEVISMRVFYMRLALVIGAYLIVLFVVEQLGGTVALHAIGYMLWFTPTFLLLDKSQVAIKRG